MKSLFLSLCLTMALSCGAQMQFVGHRGSLYGLESSVESFSNGIKLGYDYLETDVRVTADSCFVLSHDESTERLGGKLKVAEATLAELKAEELTQTRGGYTYTGHIATLGEMLDICRKGKVKPLIELKFATGINYTDQSLIPALIELIESKGFRHDCIILTSMKPCLEYIRKNYPDINLQFLTAKKWRENVDWCKSLTLDVDIQSDYVDAETVKLFHSNKAIVNIWTVNSYDDYCRFNAMGCDFITTDKLDAKQLRPYNQ
jgi:glycerophosphoryl diester phosphodiesterase